MNEQTKKIGKIILIIAGAVIVLVIVAQILSKNTPIPMTANYEGGAMIDSLGFGESFGGVVSQKATAPSIARDSVMEESVATNNQGNLADKKIEKNGQLSLYVKNIEESITGIKEAAGNLKGEVISSNVSKNVSGEKYGYITIKVPVASFEQAMGEIKKLATEVENESSNATDVTEQYVDLEARLKNLKAEEEQYIKILSKAATVVDILKVTNYLSNVRGQIEAIEGQIKYLDRQVDMSTITVNLSSDADFEVWGIRWRPLVVAKQAVKNMLSGLANYANAIISFIIVLPVIIVWLATIALIIWLGWKILRWIYLKLFAPKNIK
ncbi:MAG: DUF4349 domain-containing protein [Patescibacteria group bacterium]|nr:DUF4349 domain-containing protein [Patescibacteria group bacterium]MDD4611035.1 DUF4349 domain-containing protein [Patescibacteria group bacterium]